MARMLPCQGRIPRGVAHVSANSGQQAVISKLARPMARQGLGDMSDGPGRLGSVVRSTPCLGC